MVVFHVSTFILLLHLTGGYDLHKSKIEHEKKRGN